MCLDEEELEVDVFMGVDGLLDDDEIPDDVGLSSDGLSDDGLSDDVLSVDLSDDGLSDDDAALLLPLLDWPLL